MKFAFFGTPYVARDTLEALLAKGFKPEVVVTNPAAPKGRGYIITPSETEVFARKARIDVLTPEQLDENAVQQVKSHGCDFAVVVAYGKILSQELLDIFPQGVFNVHYSLLPKYRGATPVEAAILNGDKVTGVTLQKMVYKLDAGDIVASEEVAIEPNETTIELRKRLVEIGSDLLSVTLPKIASGNISLSIQNEEKATHSGKLKKSDGLINLESSAEENWRKYRAYAEWPGTFFFENGKRIKIKLASLEKGEFVVKRVVPEGGKEVDYKGG